MRRRHPVGLDHPRVVRARLEDELAAARAAGLQVDERPDLRRPHVLRDEAVAALQFQDALLINVQFGLRLDFVDSSAGVPPVCPFSIRSLPIFHLPKQTLAARGTQQAKRNLPW